MHKHLYDTCRTIARCTYTYAYDTEQRSGSERRPRGLGGSSHLISAPALYKQNAGRPCSTRSPAKLPLSVQPFASCSFPRSASPSQPCPGGALRVKLFRPFWSALASRAHSPHLCFFAPFSVAGGRLPALRPRETAGGRLPALQPRET